MRIMSFENLEESFSVNALFASRKEITPSDEGNEGRTLYKLKKFVCALPGKKIRSQEGTNSNFSKCMRQLPHASDKSFCDWIKILSFLLRVDQIPILDIIEF